MTAPLYYNEEKLEATAKLPFLPTPQGIPCEAEMETPEDLLTSHPQQPTMREPLPGVLAALEERSISIKDADQKIPGEAEMETFEELPTPHP